MAKTDSRFVTLQHPLTARAYAMLPDLFAMYEQQEYMRHGVSFAQGSVEEIEFRKTLDYSRDERRAAAKSGQILQFNQFKGVLPTGFTPVSPDDPSLQDPAPAAPQGA